MPAAQQTYRAIVTLLLTLLALTPGAALQAALPPIIEAKPLFGDRLVQGRWQPIVVTVTNQDTGDALTGEVTTSLEAPDTRKSSGSWTVPVTLPRGAGTVRLTPTVFIPQQDQPDIFVSLRKGRDGQGDVVTRRTFDKQQFVDPSMTILAVTAVPDALSYLRGEKLGVENSAGVMRRALDTTANKSPKQSFGRRGSATATEVRVENLPDAGLLPGTAMGYDSIAVVYLGPDIGPSQFSDSQVSSLSGWVTGGGLLVVDSPGLRDDERFRTWIPATTRAGAAGIDARKTRVGRGMAASVTGDITEAGFARSPEALIFWRGLARDACAEPLAGNLIQGRGIGSYYPDTGFWQSVIRAPGLKAPPSSAIALFLLAYLLLLVPINYFILKRLDRREWTWVTVPILVTLFSVGAYVFGYAVKGTRLLQNTVTLCEMGPDRGDAIVTASIGVFSPRQTTYDFSTSIQDATFWAPQSSRRYSGSSQDQEYGPLEVALPGNTGADSAVHIRNANISMWAMRVFAARTYQIKLGNGVAANLKREGSELRGTVTNNTGRPLEQAWLTCDGSRTDIGTLAPGEQKEVRLDLPRRGGRQPRASRTRRPVPPVPNRSSLQEFQRPVLRSLSSASEYFDQSEREKDQNWPGRNIAVLSAWNQEEIFPIKIDGQPVPTGTHLNLLRVTVPIETRQ